MGRCLSRGHRVADIAAGPLDAAAQDAVREASLAERVSRGIAPAIGIGGVRVMPKRTTASDRSEARLAGLVAIVTGASSGIGQGAAERLALDGASVCINYHAHSNPADELVDRIRSDGGSAIAPTAGPLLRRWH